MTTDLSWTSGLNGVCIIALDKHIGESRGPEGVLLLLKYALTWLMILRTKFKMINDGRGADSHGMQLERLNRRDDIYLDSRDKQILNGDA